MLEYKRTDSSTFLAHFHLYTPLIFPPALPLLTQVREPDAYWVVVEALQDGKPIGLAVAEFYPSIQTAQLFSLMVETPYRRQGIGLHLFRWIQNALIKQEGCRALTVEYEEDLPSAEALEKIFIHMQWAPPKIYLIRCWFEQVADFNPPWMHLPYRLPPDMQFFPWPLLTPQERQTLLFQERQGRFLPYLSPFRNESHIEPLNSLGIRYHQTVIGWNITHRVNADTIRYSALYIDRDFQLIGYPIFLLIESMRLHKQSPISKALFEVNLEQTNPSWHRFIQRRLIPYASHVDRIKWAARTFI